MVTNLRIDMFRSLTNQVAKDVMLIALPDGVISSSPSRAMRMRHLRGEIGPATAGAKINPSSYSPSEKTCQQIIVNVSQL